MSQLLFDPDTNLQPTNCPNCADTTVNVQGIDTCMTCSWVSR